MSVGKTHAEFAVLLKMLIGYEFVMVRYVCVWDFCDSPLYFETIYAVLLLRVGRVVVHLCDHNYSYGRIGGLRHTPPLCGTQGRCGSFSLGLLKDTQTEFLCARLIPAFRDLCRKIWATLLLDRLRDFVEVPSSAGGNSSFEVHSQSMEERAAFDRYHHFHRHAGMCAWLAS